MLSEILKRQRQLQTAMGSPMDGGTGDINTGVRENMLALIVEVTEVLNEVNWKPWRRHQLKVIDRNALLTELVDVLQFWANAVNAAGFAAEDIEAAYDVKMAECYARIENGKTTREVPSCG